MNKKLGEIKVEHFGLRTGTSIYREVSPELDKAIEGMVAALNDIMAAALNGDETTTELNCFHLAQEALEAWKRANE